MGAAFFGFRGEFHSGEIEAAQEFGEEYADGAPVEIPKGVDAEKAAFGKGEELQREVNVVGGCALPARLKVERVVAHEHG